MDTKSIVTAFVRMMERKLQLAGQEPGNYEAIEWTRVRGLAREHSEVPVLKQMLEAWYLQSQREREEIHLSQEAMMRHWQLALDAGRAYLSAREFEAEQAPPAPVAPEKALARVPQADKALKRRFTAYLKAFQGMPADASHAQWLTALARCEGFTNFQALRAMLQSEVPTFCPRCGCAGAVQETASRVMVCCACSSTFSFASSPADAERVVDSAKLKQDTLEELGYSVRRYSGAWTSQRFVWQAPTSESENPVATEAQAWESAWDDAAQQARAIAELGVDIWGVLTVQQQCQLMRERLAEV